MLTYEIEMAYWAFPICPHSGWGRGSGEKKSVSFVALSTFQYLDLLYIDPSMSPASRKHLRTSQNPLCKVDSMRRLCRKGGNEQTPNNSFWSSRVSRDPLSSLEGALPLDCRGDGSYKITPHFLKDERQRVDTLPCSKLYALPGLGSQKLDAPLQIIAPRPAFKWWTFSVTCDLISPSILSWRALISPTVLPAMTIDLCHVFAYTAYDKAYYF